MKEKINRMEIVYGIINNFVYIRTQIILKEITKINIFAMIFRHLSI